jgi:ADP-ribose pyrophosphatase YjhB (NUDIX family)
MPRKNSFCSYCGHAFAEQQRWPRTCASCSSTSYLNPLPVSVVLVPMGDGLLVVRRGIEPRRGQLALPGGFIEVGETWQQAGAREVREETGLVISPDEIRDHRVLSAPDGTVLIFGLAAPREAAELPSAPPAAAAGETESIEILRAPADLAFPLHSQVVREYFSRRA